MSKLSRCALALGLLLGTAAFTALSPGGPVAAITNGTITGTVTAGSIPAPYPFPFVTATTLDGEATFTTVGFSNGIYSLSAPPGSYCVSFGTTQTQATSVSYPAKKNCLDSITAVPVTSGGTTAGINGFLGYGSIAGKISDGGALPVPNVNTYAKRVGGNSVFGTLSQADGSYSIAHLPPGTYCVQSATPVYAFTDAAHDPCPPHTKWVVVTAGVPLTNINITVATAEFVPGGSISGHVTKAVGGAPIQNVGVYALAPDGTREAFALTAADGSYKLPNVPPGKYCVVTTITAGSTVAAEAYQNQPSCDANPTYVVVGTTAVAGIDLALDPGGSISGKITDAASGNGVQTNVEVDSVPNFDSIDVATDASGNYIATGLPAGTYCVSTEGTSTLAGRTYATGQSCTRGFTPVTVTAGTATTGINIALVPGGTISGHVTIPAGQIFHDVHVTAFAVDGKGIDSVNVDASGNYALTNSPPDAYCIVADVASTSLMLDQRFGTDSLGEACIAPPVTVTSGGTSTFDFTVHNGGSISGWEINPDLSPNDQAQPQTFPSGARNDDTRADGSYRITGLAAGSYCVYTYPGALYVMPQVYSGVFTCVTGATPVTVVAGLNTPNINFNLGASGAVSGNVLLPPGGAGFDGQMTVELHRIDAAQAVLSNSVNAGFNSFIRTYSISAPPGTYCVLIVTGDLSGAAGRAYGGTHDCTGATTVTVTQNHTTPNINITLPSQIFLPLAAPARLTDTRADGLTYDTLEQKTGAVVGGTVREVAIGGRAGVPISAASVSLNVTVVSPIAAGFLTVYPCGTTRPLASNLNFYPGETVPNSVIAALGTNGKVCVFTNVTTDLVIDIAGYFPLTRGFTPLAAPARLVDTRAGQTTVDAAEAGAGPVVGGVVRTVTVGGRAGVPHDAASVALNVTVTDPVANGFLTVYPCGTTPPLASNLNFIAGLTVPNLVITALSSAGTACIATNVSTDIVVDVAGYFPDTVGLTPLSSPVRLTDTRPDGSTVDGAEQRAGAITGGTEREVTVGGRAGVPPDAADAALNVTITNPVAPGFITVYPCGSSRPLASNLNFIGGETVANSVITKLGSGGPNTSGKVCIYTNVTTDVVVDVGGYFVG